MQKRGFKAVVMGAVWAVAGLSLVAGAARAQGPGDGGGGRGMYANMPRVMGEVTAVSGATLTVKDAEGALTTIVTTDNTRVMRSAGQMGGGPGGERGGMGNMAPGKVAEVKVGDGAMAMGQMDAPNKTLHAAVLVTTDGAVLKAYKANLGKTYIAGKVTAIDLDNAKLTVERPDGVAQVIAPDESTSFKRGRGGRGGGGMGMAGGGAAGGAAPTGESITMADVKIGDNVVGEGAVKGGAFVPGNLVVSTPRPHGTPVAPNNGAGPAK